MKAVTRLFLNYKRSSYKPEHNCRKLARITCAIYGNELYNSYIHSEDDISKKVIIRTFNYSAYKLTSDTIPDDVLKAYVEVCQIVTRNQDLYRVFSVFYQFVLDYVHNLSLACDDTLPEESPNAECREVCSIFQMCQNDLFGIFCSQGCVDFPNHPPSPSDVFVLPSKLPQYLYEEHHDLLLLQEAAILVSSLSSLKYAPPP